MPKQVEKDSSKKCLCVGGRGVAVRLLSGCRPDCQLYSMSYLRDSDRFKRLNITKALKSSDAEAGLCRLESWRVGVSCSGCQVFYS